MCASKTRPTPSTAGLPDPWVRTDEWYGFRANPRDAGVHVLLSLDEDSYTGGTMGVDHPIAWYHDYDGGRAWYTAGGHTAESYADPLFVGHVWSGIEYAAGSSAAIQSGGAPRAASLCGMAEWVYFIHPPRANFAATMTAEEREVWRMHSERLQRLLADGTLICGRPDARGAQHGHRHHPSA